MLQHDVCHICSTRNDDGCLHDRQLVTAPDAAALVPILADGVESLIGAIYIDGGFKESIKFVKKIWGPHLDIKASNIQDPKTHLQEISQQKFKKLPVYKMLKKEGPSHSPLFTVSLKALNLKIIKTTGSSIREAEKNAAEIVLKLYNDKKNS